MFHMGIDDFRRKNCVGIAITHTNQSVKMRTDELDIEYPIPTHMVLFFMGSSQMWTNNDPAIAFGEIMDFFHGQIDEPANSSVITNVIMALWGFDERDIKIASNKYGFVDEIGRF